MTPEGKVKERVKKLLKKYGVYHHWPVLNGIGAPTLDCVLCHHGRFAAIETKAGDKRPTPRQEVTMEAMAAAGGKTFLVNDVTGLNELEAWLKEVGHADNNHD